MTGLLRPRPILIAVGCLFAVALVYSGYWAYAARAFENSIETWIDHGPANGIWAGYESIDISGFPLRIEAHLGKPRLREGRNGRSLAWDAPELTLAIRPWIPTRLNLALPMTHRIVRADGQLTRSLTINMTQGFGRIILGPWGTPGTHSLDAAMVSIQEQGHETQLDIARLQVRANTYRIAAGDTDAASLDILLDVEDVRLPQDAVDGLGQTIERVLGQASIRGAVRPDAMPAALARWRDDGGIVELNEIQLHWGPLMLSGEGTLALDKDMQPIGAVTARLRGFSETLDALVAAEAMKPVPAAAAKVLLRLMAKVPPGGGPPVLEVPLTAQNGRLYVGPISLVKIPPIRWD